MIPPPPPPPRSFRLIPPPPPPPKRPWYGDEPEIVPISPDLSRIDLEAAIWVHGGYPQVPWAEAARELLRKCHATPLGQICSAAIDILDLELPADFDLTFDRFATNSEPDLFTNPIKGVSKC